jgi:hypothetical protein
MCGLAGAWLGVCVCGGEGVRVLCVWCVLFPVSGVVVRVVRVVWCVWCVVHVVSTLSIFLSNFISLADYVDGFRSDVNDSYYECDYTFDAVLRSVQAAIEITERVFDGRLRNGM